MRCVDEQVDRLYRAYEWVYAWPQSMLHCEANTSCADQRMAVRQLQHDCYWGMYICSVSTWVNIAHGLGLTVKAGQLSPRQSHSQKRVARIVAVACTTESASLPTTHMPVNSFLEINSSMSHMGMALRHRNHVLVCLTNFMSTKGRQ